MALFERVPRKVPLVGKVVGVTMVDEISDRTWVIINAVDGRVHYAEFARLKPEAAPVRGNIVAHGRRVPRTDLMKALRQVETQRLAADVSRRLNAAFVPSSPGPRITRTLDHAVATPTSQIAIIRREDTFTLAPWRQALKPFRGHAVAGIVSTTCVTWTLDRGRSLATRTP